MKKMLLLLTACITLAGVSAQKKKNISGSAMYAGVSYSMPHRPGFEKYIAVVSDSLHLSSSLNTTKSIGFHAGYLGRNGNNEIEAGIALFKSFKIEETSTTNSAVSSLTGTNIDVHFGYNHYTGPLLLGFDLGVINNSAKLNMGGISNTNAFEASPESSNPFKGYSFFLRPKAGFFFPFKEAEGNTGIRLNAYYDLGFTKYNFYDNDLINKRLKNYTGEKKSGYNSLGVELILVLGLHD
ncbi:MAG: hypothetical protein QM725_12890 [Lacibacter sp.]